MWIEISNVHISYIYIHIYICIYIRNLCVCVHNLPYCSWLLSRLHFMSVIFYSSTVIWQSSLLFPPWNVTVVLLALQAARPSQTWKIPIKERRNISNSAVWGTVFNNCTCKHQGIQRTIFNHCNTRLSCLSSSSSLMIGVSVCLIQICLCHAATPSPNLAGHDATGLITSLVSRFSLNEGRKVLLRHTTAIHQSIKGCRFHWLHCPWWAHRPPSTPQTWNGVENCHRLCSFGFPPGRLLWRPQQWYNGFLCQRATPHGAVYGASHIDSQLLQKHIFCHMMCPQKWEARKLSDWLQFCWKWMWMWLFQVSYISLWSGAFACTCWDTFDPYLLGASCEK